MRKDLSILAGLLATVASVSAFAQTSKPATQTTKNDYLALIRRAVLPATSVSPPSDEVLQAAKKAMEELKQDKEAVASYIISALQDISQRADDLRAMGSVLCEFGPEYVARLDPAVLGSKDQNVRSLGVEILGRDHSPQSTKLIVKMLESDESPRVQKAAIRYLDVTNTHPDLVAGFLKSRDAAVRKAAIGYFWSHPSAQHRPALEAMLTSETDPVVGFWVGWTLSSQGYDIVPLVSHAQPGIRSGALYFAITIPLMKPDPLDIQEAVLRQLEVEKDPICLLQIACYLENRHDKRCLPIYIQLLKSGDRTTHPYQGGDVSTISMCSINNILFGLLKNKEDFYVSDADRAKFRQSQGNLYARVAELYEKWWDENHNYVQWDKQKSRWVATTGPASAPS